MLPTQAATSPVDPGPAEIAPHPIANATAIAATVPVHWVSMIAPSRKIQVRAVTGRFARWRWALVVLTQLLFYGLPWLPWHGRPAVLFDLETRRFYLFELVLYPQDFIYLTALLVISALALFFVTAVAGRLWCGYACPQTVYTEVFMWLERRIEGDRTARLRLDRQPWSAATLWRRGAKHLTWGVVALWTGVTFVGYFTPIRVLVPSLAGGHLGAWEMFWVPFYGLATYGNAGFLREQVCKHMCPYARFQGAMFDRDTLIIGYDTRRGEPRGSRARGADAKALGLGACVNCTMCVQVCPTGIDIRDGLQSDCIACGACIDACDAVMDRLQYPRGLVRYATQRSLGNEQAAVGAPEWRKRLRLRVVVYGLLLLGVSVAFVAGLAARSPVRLNVVRDRGVMARVVEGGNVENVYRLQLMNATDQWQRLQLHVTGQSGLQLEAPAELSLPPAAERAIGVSVRGPASLASGQPGAVLPIAFEVRLLPSDAAAAPLLHEPSAFLLPR